MFLCVFRPETNRDGTFLCGTVPTDMSSVDPDTYSRTVVSLSQRQTLVSEVSNAVALNFLDLYSFGLHRKERNSHAAVQLTELIQSQLISLIEF